MKRKTVLKRTLACCLAVILMLTGVPLASLSGIDPANFKDFFSLKASAETWENLTYEVSNGEATITGCSDSISGAYTIPSTLGGYPVTSIGDWAFDGCTGLTSVTIPDSVTSIGGWAFRRCTGLTSMTIPDSVTSIGDCAFLGCTGLTSITIPDSVTSIGHSAFYGCTGLTSITIPDSVTSIGGNAFRDCTGLTSITISNSVTSIDYYAFDGCTGLTSITIPDSVTSIGQYAFYGCIGLTSVTIGNSVTSIGDCAFEGCTGLTSMTIPDSVTSIGHSAFYGCTGLTSIAIPDSVTNIGKLAFWGCKGLTSVIIGNGVTNIGDSAFYNCTSLTSITIPDSVTNIGGRAFSNCAGLASLTVDSGNNVYHSKNNCIIKTEEKELVTGCKNSVIPLDGSVTSIDSGAFSGCTGLTSIIIPDGVTSIGVSAFYECYGLKSITISDNVTSIGVSAFSGCHGLTSIEIPDSVTSMGAYAFSGCIGLTSVTIGNGVIDMDRTFIWCTNLASVTIGNSVEYIGYSTFEKCTNLTSVTIPDSVTNIGDCAFRDCTNLTSVTIGNSVKEIHKTAFRGCANLTNITVDSGNKMYYSKNNCIIKTEDKRLFLGFKNSIIPSDGSVTSIGSSAFDGCTGLTSIAIPDSVTSIGESAFRDCTGLTSITIPDSITSIGRSAFYGCDGLTSITIPDSVTSIGDYAFYDCSGLTSVIIGNGVTNIGGETFRWCSGLTSITIPNSVTRIGSWAFSGCNGLTSITIPDSVKSIGDYAFDLCSGLKTVYYAGTKEQWESIDIGRYNYPLENADIVFGACDASIDNAVYKDKEISFNDGKVHGETMISFDPSWFSEDSINYNHNLAKLTSQFAMLGYAKKAELKNALEAIGFTVDEDYIDLKTGIKRNGETDTEESKKRVNYFIAHKKMIINGEETTLVFMGLIGSSHNQWYSNFDPGKISGIHKGFMNASKFIINLDYTGVLDKYFNKYLSGEKNVKILITGHSRGAATANLVASTLISNHRYASEENIYTYTYATPNVTKVKNTAESRFKRIFNFVNPEDFVTKCMPTSWGYKRYGTTFTLPSKTNEGAANYSRYYNKMNPVFCRYYKTGVPYQPYFEGEKPVYDVVSKLTSTVKSTDEMYSKKMHSGSGSKSTYEFFQQSLCPVVADNGKLELLAGLKNMLKAWLMPSACKTYKTVTEFFLKHEAAGMVNEAISKGWLDVDLSANVKAEQLDEWARNGQKNFSHAHIAQTYAAFIDTMTEEEVKQERASYRHTVNCPVDIEVYERSTGDLVGKIVNNIIYEDVAGKENAVVMDVDGDSKSFWLPSNGDYEVKLIGNDDGTMDYTVANVDSDLGETERVNFFDVKITDGLTMTGEMKTDTVLEDYSLEYDNGNKMTPAETLSGDEITSYNINVSVEGNGYATESMTASSGDYVTVNAMETVGNSTDGWYIFDGWYEDEEKVSSERSFSFVAKGNRSLIAKFVWSDVCLHPMQEELIEIPATCTESGNEPGVFCMMCETYLSGGKEIPALGHDIVTDIEAVRPTCTENGRTKGVHCTRCDYKVEAVELKPLGHVDDDNDRVCERCGKEAAIEGTCGENAFYKYYPDGELIISGTGAVTGFDGFRYSKDVLKVTVLDGITSLGYACFFEFCNMEEVIIGADLLEIKENAFSTGTFSRKLRNIEVSADNPVFHSDGNCLIKTETKELVLGCNNSVIPTDGSVTAITMGAFDGCDEIKELFIPKCVISIDEMPIVCINSNLSSIVVEEGNPVYRSNGNCLINIETGALVLGCNNSVIPTDGSVKSICSGAFVGYNDLTELVIPASVTNIDLPAVYACGGIRKLLVEEGNAVYHSSGNCIIDTANKKLVLGCCSSEIPDDGSVEIIESASFAFIDSLNLIKIPEGVKSIMSEAFIGCNNMNTIVLPKSITSINDCYLGYIFDFNTGMTYLNDSFTIVGYAGSFAEQYASNCGMHFVDLATHTHEYGQYTVKFEPTCTDDGMEERTCSVCGDKQTITVAALGHDLVIDVEAKEATCTQSGTTEGVHCTRCDYKVEAVEIKPLGHTDEDNDGNCDRCGERIGDPAPTDPPQNCSCACHKKGIANFFFKIILFFQKIFKKNRVCNCGVWHY